MLFVVFSGRTSLHPACFLIHQQARLKAFVATVQFGLNGGRYNGAFKKKSRNKLAFVDAPLAPVTSTPTVERVNMVFPLFVKPAGRLGSVAGVAAATALVLTGTDIQPVEQPAGSGFFTHIATSVIVGSDAT